MRNTHMGLLGCLALGWLAVGSALAADGLPGPNDGVVVKNPPDGYTPRDPNSNPGQGGRRGGGRNQGGKQGNPKDPLNDPAYKEKLADNYASVKELFDQAEAAFKAQSYREAASFYRSVTLATAPKSEPLVAASRKRLLEIEGLAQEHLKAADDADLGRDYVKEVEELSIVIRDFAFTKANETALSRMVALKSRREVAALVEYAQAEAAEASGDLIQARKLYQAIADNVRYECSLAAMKAKRKVEMLPKDEATKDALKAQELAVADKEAPVLLNTARNYILNSRFPQAKEKLQAVVEKFPGTKYAEEAQQELAKLP